MESYMYFTMSARALWDVGQLNNINHLKNILQEKGEAI